MTRRNANHVYEEIEVMKEQLNRVMYGYGTLVSELRAIRAALEASNGKVIAQLTDTQATLDYLKSYIGIDEFFNEALRQGKGSAGGSMEAITIEQLKRSRAQYEAEKDT